MKRYITAVGLMMALLTPTIGVAKENKTAKGDAAIEFVEVKHDFGTVNENGGPVSTEFRFTNTGDAPLLIINATASCGCTRPEFPKKPIAPGKSDKIKVTYLPQGRPGEFNKTITVKSNAKKKGKVTLKINGYVNPSGK